MANPYPRTCIFCIYLNVDRVYRDAKTHKLAPDGISLRCVWDHWSIEESAIYDKAKLQTYVFDKAAVCEDFSQDSPNIDFSKDN